MARRQNRFKGNRLNETSRRFPSRRRLRLEPLESRVVLSATSLTTLMPFEAIHDHLHDDQDHLFTWEPVATDSDLLGAEAGDGTAGPLSGPVPISSLPLLNSNPGAPVDLFLDFDGHFQATWGGYTNATTPVYDIDGDRTTFSDVEISRILAAFEIVAEDFAPFNVNVTTVEPAVLASGVPESEANGRALRVAIGGSWQDWYGGSAGGVGYIDNFTSTIANVVYVFSDNTGDAVGHVSSHEAGHGLGLRHQSLYDSSGNLVQTYHPGDGYWGPIMGYTYGRTVLAWHNGTTTSATTFQDDLAILARPANGFGYRGDDHGNTSQAATPLAYDGTHWTGAGIIATNSDIDVYRFSPTSSGDHRIRVDLDNESPNLDVVLEMRNSAGVIVASAAPADSLDAQLYADLVAGENYYISVTKTNTYGYVGQYAVNAVAVAPGPRIVATSVDDAVEGDFDTIRVTFNSPVDSTTFNIDDVQLSGPGGPIVVAGVAAVSGSNDTQFDIQFATQSSAGFYDLAIAPTLADPGGNLMNQDRDVFPGEAIEDRFSRRFISSVPGSAFLVKSSSGNVYAHDVEIDDQGYIYLTGVISSGTADFDPGPGVTTLTSTAFSDGYVAKYSPGFDLIWVSQMQSPGNLFSYELEFDSQRNIYLAGSFSTGTATFGQFTLNNQGSNDAFLAKMNPQGEFLWARGWGGTDAEYAYGLRITPDNTIHVGGYFGGTVDFNPSTPTFNMTAFDTASDAFLARFDLNGNFLTATALSGPGADLLRRLDDDDQGSLYASGTFAQTIRLDASNTLTSAGTSDMYVAKFNSNHGVQWARQISSPSSVLDPKLVVDSTGNVYAAGYFEQTVDFGPGTPTFTNSGGRDAFIVKWNNAGDFLWARQINGGEAILRPIGLDADQNGNVYLTGQFTGTVDFGFGPEVVSMTSLDGQNDFLLGLDSEGNYRAAHQVARVNNGFIRAMGVGPGGNVYLAGDFVESVWLPTGEQYVHEPGPRDMYVAKLVLAPGITVSPSANLTTNEAGGTATFSVVLDMPPTADVNVPVSSGDASEGSVSTSTLTFTPTNWNVPQLVTVTGVDDIVDDGDVGYTIILSSATSADAAYHGLNAADVTVTNLDNDAPLFADSFDVGEWNGIWVEDSQNDWYRSSQRATSGSYSAEIDGSAANATLTMASSVDLRPYGSGEISFSWFIESTLDTNEYLAVDVFNGTWREVARLRGNVDQENVWHHQTIALASADMVAGFKIRFRGQMSDSTEDANVDNIRISPTSLPVPNQLPTAEAGGPYAMNEGGNVTLTAAGSFDPDGSIASYAWDLDGDGQYDDATGATTTFSTIQDGVRVVGLQVTDNRGGSSTDTAVVTVSNLAPLASAGGPYSGFVGQTLTLSAAASSDPGNDIASYAWDLDGDGQYDDASGSSASFLRNVPGNYPVSVRVTDDDGASTIASTSAAIASVPTEAVVFADSFEVGEWNGLWTEDSQNDWFRSTQRETHGNYSAEVDGSASGATLTMASTLNLTSYASAELTFSWFIENSFDAGEYLALDVFNGTTWTSDVRRFNGVSGNNSAENVWQAVTVDLSPYMSGSTRVRFRAVVSDSTEDANVDNVRIVARGAAPAPALDQSGPSPGEGWLISTPQSEASLARRAMHTFFDRLGEGAVPSLAQSIAIVSRVQSNRWWDEDGFLLDDTDPRILEAHQSSDFDLAFDNHDPWFA